MFQQVDNVDLCHNELEWFNCIMTDKNVCIKRMNIINAKERQV